jgi:hypothetical protein
MRPQFSSAASAAGATKECRRRKKSRAKLLDPSGGGDVQRTPLTPPSETPRMSYVALCIFAGTAKRDITHGVSSSPLEGEGVHAQSSRISHAALAKGRGVCLIVVMRIGKFGHWGGR